MIIINTYVTGKFRKKNPIISTTRLTFKRITELLHYCAIILYDTSELRHHRSSLPPYIIHTYKPILILIPFILLWSTHLFSPQSNKKNFAHKLHKKAETAQEVTTSSSRTNPLTRGNLQAQRKVTHHQHRDYKQVRTNQSSSPALG